MRGGDAGGPVAARFDPPALLARLPDLDLTFEGWCPGGEQGAAYVRGPDGRRSVLRWSLGPLAPSRVHATEVADAARRAGVPVPADEVLRDLGDGVVWIQELRPGRPGAHLTMALLDQLLTLLQRRRGLFAGARGFDLHLLDDGPGFCLHDPMRAAGGRAARLLGWVEEVGRAVGDGPRLPGTDAVHFDHHPGNVLVDDAGTVTALIDWDAARIGNADLDLVTLRFGVRGYGVDLDVDDRLASLVAALPDAVRRPAWAHMSLRLVDWSLRFHPDEVDRWLDVAESGVD